MHNESVTSTASPLRQIVLAALVVIGIIGMHHLVVSACHQVSSHIAHHVAGESTVEPTSTEPISTEPISTQPASGSGSTDVGSTFMTCLAVLVLAALMMRPRRALSPTENFADRATPHRHSYRLHELDPPDLMELSISRT